MLFRFGALNNSQSMKSDQGNDKLLTTSNCGLSWCSSNLRLGVLASAAPVGAASPAWSFSSVACGTVGGTEGAELGV